MLRRNTKGRKAIVQTLENVARPISAGEILKISSEQCADLNKTTVYRFIKYLLSSREVLAISFPGKATLYELNRAGEHHHFVCEACQGITRLTGVHLKLEDALPTGYELSSPSLLISGKCSSCVSG